MMGRVNFGPALLQERKGLVGPGSVQLGTPFTGPLRAILGWEILPLPMEPWGPPRRPKPINPKPINRSTPSPKPQTPNPKP